MRQVQTSLFLLLLMVFPYHLGATDSEGLLEVRKALMCTCDNCVMVLYNCHCGTADKMVATIRDMLDDGMSKEDVVQGYVARYGQAILAAPPKEGFSLLAWVVPFVILGAASTLVVALLKRWTSKEQEGEYRQKDLTPLDEAQLAKVEQEMKELGI